MNLLFVCSRNRLRSPTAETIFAGLDGYNVLSAGTNPDAETIVSADLVEWADTIFAMQAVHRRRLTQRFGPGLRIKRLIPQNSIVGNVGLSPKHQTSHCRK